MSLKVWVKLGGAPDEEALGIQVPINGTAQTVVEACRGVFRHLKPSHVALRTEDGIIVALASPVSALQTHTLELIEPPPLEPPKKNTKTANLNTSNITPNTSRIVGRTQSSYYHTLSNAVPPVPRVKKGTRSTLKRSATAREKPSPEKITSILPPHQSKTARCPAIVKEHIVVGNSLKALWDTLPTFTPDPLHRSVPAVTGILQTARFVTFAEDPTTIAVELVKNDETDHITEPSNDNNLLKSSEQYIFHSNNMKKYDSEVAGGYTVEVDEKKNLSPSRKVIFELITEEVIDPNTDNPLLNDTVNIVTSPVTEKEVSQEVEIVSAKFLGTETDVSDALEEKDSHNNNNGEIDESTKKMVATCETTNILQDKGANYFDEW